MVIARILIVDDEADISSILKKGLELAGFDVTVFRDPLEALSNFRAGRFDLLVLDVRMPEMDGFTLYQRMREIDGNVKVCFLTAFDIEYRKEFRSGFPDLDTKCFMKKPVSIRAIIQMIQAELGLA